MIDNLTFLLTIIFCVVVYIFYNRKIESKYNSTSEKFNTNIKSTPLYNNYTPNFVQDYLNDTFKKVYQNLVQ